MCNVSSNRTAAVLPEMLHPQLAMCVTAHSPIYSVDDLVVTLTNMNGFVISDDLTLMDTYLQVFFPPLQASSSSKSKINVQVRMVNITPVRIRLTSPFKFDFYIS